MTGLFLLARVAGRRVAIGADRVESVVDIARVTPVPLAPRYVRGVAALRSRVVTVIDTTLALGAAENTDLHRQAGSARAVITIVDGHHYALLVDEVDDVASFALGPLVPGVALTAGWGRVARGVIEQDGEPVLAIDAAALVPALAIVA